MSKPDLIRTCPEKVRTGDAAPRPYKRPESARHQTQQPRTEKSVLSECLFPYAWFGKAAEGKHSFPTTPYLGFASFSPSFSTFSISSGSSIGTEGNSRAFP